MPKRPADRSIVAGVIAVLAVIAAVILVAIYLWPDSDPPPDAKTAPASKTPSVSVPAPKKPAPVLDFDRIDKDEPLKKLNKERKKAYGIEKEVDFIAREDETIRIGDETVPMKEILDKIRLKEGEILESDLGGGPAPRTLAEKSRQLSREIEAVEKRISELTGTADPPAPDATPGVGAKTTTDAGSKTAPGPGAKAAPAGETPRRIAEKLEKYKETLTALEEAYRNRANQPPGEESPLDAEIAALEMEKSALEKQLRAHLPAEGYEDSKGLFGIHVVKPGDNIWNIHFQVLKAFFKSKGVVLSPLADEADEKGRSSGVGKLLKFSEAKVYIYNLRERKLDMNLHLIHPLSKIVIFDFAEYFTLLERIDNKNVHHIEYDGETLWIPPAR